MATAKARPSFKDCLNLSSSLIRNVFGLAGQILTVGAVETAASVGRQLTKATSGLERARGAVGNRFDYTAPQIPAKNGPQLIRTPKSVEEVAVDVTPAPVNSYVKV